MSCAPNRAALAFFGGGRARSMPITVQFSRRRRVTSSPSVTPSDFLVSNARKHARIHISARGFEF
eukprot:950433-Pleurochrysis_carterae.AAC.1